MVDKLTDVEAVTHEVYTALIETAKSPPHGPGSAQSSTRTPTPFFSGSGFERRQDGGLDGTLSTADFVVRVAQLGRGINPQAEHPEVHARWFLPW